MAFGVGGTFSRLYNWVQDRNNGIKVVASKMDEEMDSIATALSTCITKSGLTTPTANLPMGNYKHTGVGDAAARNQYASAGQIQDEDLIWCGTASGTTDAIELSPSPAITGYAEGQRFAFVSSGANTGAATVNVSGLGVKSVTRNGSTALAAGHIHSGVIVTIQYDGTRFQLPNSGYLPDVGGAVGGPITAANGSASAPSYSFTSEAATGFYRPTSDAIAASINGSERWRTTAAGFAVGAADIIDPSSGATDGVTSSYTGFLSASLASNAPLRLRRRTTSGNIALFYSDTSLVGDISVTGSSTSYNSASDVRLKSDIRPLLDSGQIMDRLEPSTWDWKYIPGAPRGVGFIAQNLRRIVPEAVSPGDDDPSKRPDDEGFQQWGVDPAKLVPYLVAEVKSLRQRLAALEAA